MMAAVVETENREKDQDLGLLDQIKIDAQNQGTGEEAEVVAEGTEGGLEVDIGAGAEGGLGDVKQTDRRKDRCMTVKEKRKSKSEDIGNKNGKDK